MKIGIHCAGRDAGLAQSIGERVERSLGIEIQQETGGCFVDQLGTLWDADFLVVLLSKDTAPARWVREEWQRALWEEPEENGSRVLCVLTGDCPHPELMERRRPRYRFLDGRLQPDAVAAVLREWVLEVRRGDQPRRFLPGDDALPVDEAVMDGWRRRAVEIPGIVAAQGPAGAGKTDLAEEFARRFHTEFEDVIWVSCSGRSSAETAGDAASLLGMKLTKDTERCLSQLRRVMRERRLLLVLDGADRVGHLELIAEGWCSTLVTSRMELGEFEPAVLPAKTSGGRQGPEALSVCRKDALLPALLRKMDVTLDGLHWLDRQGGWMRASGYREDDARRAALELQHADAVLQLAREDAGEQILPDLFLAARRMLRLGDLDRAADLARRAERISRTAHRTPEQVEILTLVAEAAWERGKTAVCDSFARDLVAVHEDQDDVENARMWHARISRPSGAQMMLPMELDFSAVDW